MFWNKIGDLVFKSIVESIEEQQLGISQRRAIINIIPKAGKDLRYIKKLETDLALKRNL